MHNCAYVKQKCELGHGPQDLTGGALHQVRPTYLAISGGRKPVRFIGLLACSRGGPRVVLSVMNDHRRSLFGI